MESDGRILQVEWTITCLFGIATGHGLPFLGGGEKEKLFGSGSCVNRHAGS